MPDDLTDYLDSLIRGSAWAETGVEAAQYIRKELGWRPPRRQITMPDHGMPPPPTSLPPGFIVAYIAELDDDSEGPQLMHFSEDVLPTEEAAREQHSDAEDWRPGWRIYQLADVTERLTMAGRTPDKIGPLHADRADADRALVEAVDNVKRLGGAVEIRGVRIEPCDLQGETATTRNVAAFGEQLGAMESELVRARARIAELEGARAEPHAFVAVKRTFSPNADGPEWAWDAAVIPAGDYHSGDRDYHERRGYELLPIVGTDDGTKWIPGTQEAEQ